MPHRILIVDDHGPTRQEIRSLLKREGLEVCGEAANGKEAIEKVKELMPDLVILDISMPLMNGFEALPAMLKYASRMKVVIFTVDDAKELRGEAFRLGARAYVAKSEPPEGLLGGVKRLLSETP